MPDLNVNTIHEIRLDCTDLCLADSKYIHDKLSSFEHTSLEHHLNAFGLDSIRYQTEDMDSLNEVLYYLSEIGIYEDTDVVEASEDQKTFGTDWNNIDFEQDYQRNLNLLEPVTVSDIVLALEAAGIEPDDMTPRDVVNNGRQQLQSLRDEALGILASNIGRISSYIRFFDIVEETKQPVKPYIGTPLSFNDAMYKVQSKYPLNIEVAYKHIEGQIREAHKLGMETLFKDADYILEVLQD